MGLLQHPQATHAVLVLVKNLGAKLHAAGKVGGAAAANTAALGQGAAASSHLQGC